MKRHVGIATLVVSALVLLAGLLLGVHLLVMQSFESAMDEAGSRLRDAHADRLASEVEDYLGQAVTAVDGVEAALSLPRCGSDSAFRVRGCLEDVLLANPDLAEVTFTRADIDEWDESGDPVIDPSTRRWQLSVIRSQNPETISVRTIQPGRNGFVASETSLDDSERSAQGAVDDPTEHLTFHTPAGKSRAGQVLWTDLSYSELDSHLPESGQRVVVTALRSVVDGDKIKGVIRVGLLTAELDRRFREASAEQAPHLLFIADWEGRLVSRPGESDRLFEDSDGSLRVDLGGASPELTRVLSLPGLEGLSSDRLRFSGKVEVNGRPFLVSYRYLPGSQDWRVGVLVPQEFYLSGLDSIRSRLGTFLVVLLGAAALLGFLCLEMIQRGFKKIHGQIRSIMKFDFEPAKQSGVILREVDETLDGLEQSKTALRAMSRYVPVSLVRGLLESNKDPKLGGVNRDVTIMFTDIEGFTSIAETIETEDLAEILGRYFELMTGIVHEHKGTLDKYIGDALMVLFNAPTDVEGHPTKACEAALSCLTALEACFASSEWSGLPPLPTRFGLHRDEVLVGHFGAPDRINYSALGDGVNLASRLEGLNKVYGTSILVSETVASEVRSTHALRRLDRVAVKGKVRGVEVYELIGRKGADPKRARMASEYERGLEAYQRASFREALELFGALPEDSAAAVMRARCEIFLEQPPSKWDGIWVAREK